MQIKFKCLYCDKSKCASESSLEHAIPQFMGGDFAPEIFKIENVCKKCNNNLGLWVDAAYAKSWFVTNELAEAARLLCAKPSAPGLPLVCMGEAKIAKLVIPEGNIAEHWIGPSGETITWIRPHDERMASYTGGNPISTKKIPSTAYFFPVSEAAEKYEMGLRSFFRALNKRKTRKILCATIVDIDGKTVNPEKMGFEAPNPEDVLNSSTIREAMLSGPIHINFAVNTKFDHRFICKLALGIGYSLFGKYFLENGIAKEARRGVWPDRDGAKPQLRGASTIFAENLPYNTLSAYPGAVSIAILCSNNSWIMSVSVNGKFPFFVELGPSSMHSEHVDRDQGYMLLLFPYLESCIQLTVAELIAHRSGEMKHPELEKIDNIQKEARAFHERLQAI